MVSTIVKYTTDQLIGYGFDVAADRVVRFNKHPDGTYLNTRATYSINKSQYTHHHLRTVAIHQSQQTDAPLPRSKKIWWWVLGMVMVGIIVSTSTCTFTSDISVTQSITE